MSEEMAEKVIFSITPDAIKPKGAATRRPSEKEITKDSTSNHEKPVPRYLRGPISTCHDLCKHGIKHDEEVKKSNTFPPRTSGLKLKLKQVKDVNQETMNNKEHKRITSLRDLPPEKIIRVPDSPSYIVAGSIDELSTLKFNSPICDESRSSFHLSAKETDKPSGVSSSVASIVPLAAVDINASKKHGSAELTDGLMDESSMKSDATDTSNMDNEEDTPFNQIEASHLEPICIKFMIPKQLPQATATPTDISNDQSEGSTADSIVTHSMEKCIVYESSTSNGAQESSGAKINMKKNSIGSSVERMKLKNQNNMESSMHRPVKQVGAKEASSKVKPATCGNTPPIKAPAATCGTVSPEKQKTSSVTKRSIQTVARAPTDRSEGLPRKPIETKSLSKHDQRTKREMDKVKISPSGRVKVKNQDNNIKEPSPFKENIGLQKVAKPVKAESDEMNQKSKDSGALKRNKEKIAVAANKLIHGGDEALEPLGNIQSKKTHDSKVPSLKLRKERITNPPSAAKSQSKVGRLVSKTKIVPVGTSKVDRIDLKGIKEKLRKHNHINEGDSQKELVERKPGEVTKSVSNTRYRQTPSSLVDNRTSTHRKLSSTRGKLVNLQSGNNTPLSLKFMRARTVTGNHSAKGQARTKSSGNHIRSTTADLNPMPEVSKVVLRHQEVQDKREAQGLFNNVIEETASKLVETRKSKVKALVGAFETVISLQESKLAPIGAVP